MPIRALTYALAAAGMTLAATAQAAGPVPTRDGSPVADAEQLSGRSGFLPVAIVFLAMLSILVFGDDDDRPTSP